MSAQSNDHRLIELEAFAASTLTCEVRQFFAAEIATVKEQQAQAIRYEQRLTNFIAWSI